MSTSQQKTTLNPSATEFVPSFALQQNLVPTNNGTNNGGGYVNNNSHYNNQRNHQHYNNSNNNSYQNHHHHNNNNNNRSNHYNNNNNQYRNNNGSFYNNNGTYINPNDVDPIEIEARCEAVIEILQDDNIRDQLNPSSRFETTNHQSNSTNNNNNNNNYGYNYDDNQEPPCDDEEEMLEMMAMQEECRLEMMKFYIQSQNPSLFEEIYHDVSYPDAVKKPTEELRDPIVKPATSINNTITTTETKSSSSTEPTQVDVTPTTTTISTHTDDSNLTTESTELKDLIINHLNPDAYEFIPSKFSNLNLNDDSVETTANEAN